jgi:hypothetical protein
MSQNQDNTCTFCGRPVECESARFLQFCNICLAYREKLIKGTIRDNVIAKVLEGHPVLEERRYDIVVAKSNVTKSIAAGVEAWKAAIETKSLIGYLKRIATLRKNGGHFWIDFTDNVVILDEEDADYHQAVKVHTDDDVYVGTAMVMSDWEGGEVREMTFYRPEFYGVAFEIANPYEIARKFKAKTILTALEIAVNMSTCPVASFRNGVAIQYERDWSVLCAWE